MNGVLLVIIVLKVAEFAFAEGKEAVDLELDEDGIGDGRGETGVENEFNFGDVRHALDEVLDLGDAEEGLVKVTELENLLKQTDQPDFVVLDAEGEVAGFPAVGVPDEKLVDFQRDDDLFPFNIAGRVALDGGAVSGLFEFDAEESRREGEECECPSPEELGFSFLVFLIVHPDSANLYNVYSFQPRPCVILCLFIYGSVYIVSAVNVIVHVN